MGINDYTADDHHELRDLLDELACKFTDADRRHLEAALRVWGSVEIDATAEALRGLGQAIGRVAAEQGEGE